MRRRRLLILLCAGLVSACVPGQVLPGPDTVPLPGAPGAIPADAGTVSLESSGDGITLFLHGILTRERFTLDSIHPVGSRLASRSPDPDQFRVVRFSASGQALDTVHLWSPLDTFEWDSAGQHERRVTATDAVVALPVPAYLGVAAVELQWTGGAGLGPIDVSAVLLRFCATSPRNPGCRL